MASPEKLAARYGDDWAAYDAAMDLVIELAASRSAADNYRCHLPGRYCPRGQYAPNGTLIEKHSEGCIIARAREILSGVRRPRPVTRDQVRAEYNRIQDNICRLREAQEQLPRCEKKATNPDRGPCCKYLGHDYDHASPGIMRVDGTVERNAYDWPNYGKYGNRTSQWDDEP